MPKYDYKCYHCGEYFERERTYADFGVNPDLRCPICTNLLKQVFLPTGLPSLSNKACPSRKWQYGKCDDDIEENFNKKEKDGTL